MKASKLQRLQETARERNAPEPTKPETTSIALDKHFSVGEIAELLRMHPVTVRRIFGNAVGVIKLGSAKRRILYIPARVLEEKHRELAE